MRICEITAPLYPFVAVLRVLAANRLQTVRTRLYADSLASAYAMLNRAYGAKHVVSVRQGLYDVVGESSNNPSTAAADLQVKSMKNRAKQLNQQAKQLKAQSDLQAAQKNLAHAYKARSG